MTPFLVFESHRDGRFVPAKKPFPAEPRKRGQFAAYSLADAKSGPAVEVTSAEGGAGCETCGTAGVQRTETARSNVATAAPVAATDQRARLWMLAVGSPESGFGWGSDFRRASLAPMER